MNVLLGDGAKDIGDFCDVERMLCAALHEMHAELAGRHLPVISATNVEADAITTHGLPLATVRALNGLPIGTWQTPNLGYVWDVPWSVVGEGRDAAFTLAVDTYQILHRLPGVVLVGPGGGVFEAVVDTDLPTQSVTAQLRAQEIVQFDGAVRVTVSPDQGE